MTPFRILTALIISLAVIWGCSRKADESLPARTGNLLVRFTIHDESSYLSDPANIPVIVSIYADTLHTHLIASQDIMAADDATREVTFPDLPVSFYWMEMLVNESGLPDPCHDVRVFIQQNITTSTDDLEYTLRQDFWICPDLGP